VRAALSPEATALQRSAPDGYGPLKLLTRYGPQLKEPSAELSVVIPCIGGMRGYLERCADHVVKHTSLGHELIIVCDAPTLSDLDLLLRLHQDGARLILSPDLMGCASAYNLGVAASRGRYIAIVSVDCLVGPGCLDRLVEALRGRPEWGWASAAIVGGEGRVEHTFAALTCAVLTREAVERVQVGGRLLDPRFDGGVGFEDDDLYRRFLMAGYEPHGVLGAQCIHVEPQSTMKRRFGAGRLEAFRRNRTLFVEKWAPFYAEMRGLIEGDPRWRAARRLDGTDWHLVPYV